MAMRPSSTVRTTQWRPVGTPAASIMSFAYALEPSSRAGSRAGPKHGTPATSSASASPATSGASGPTTPMSTSNSVASARMPAFPGAHSSSGRCGDRASARTIACSRPPPPRTRTFKPQPPLLRSSEGLTPSQRGDEVVDRDRGHRLVVRRAARAELERDARHRLLVGRLHDVDEVEVAEGRPLRLDRRAELLDLVVHLADAGRVVANGLHALGRECGEHDPGRHGVLLGGLPGALYPILPNRCRVFGPLWILCA